jgi:hypothetical protein
LLQLRNHILDVNELVTDAVCVDAYQDGENEPHSERHKKSGRRIPVRQQFPVRQPEEGEPDIERASIATMVFPFA